MSLHMLVTMSSWCKNNTVHPMITQWSLTVPVDHSLCTFIISYVPSCLMIGCPMHCNVHCSCIMLITEKKHMSIYDYFWVIIPYVPSCLMIGSLETGDRRRKQRQLLPSRVKSNQVEIENDIGDHEYHYHCILRPLPENAARIDNEHPCANIR